jgi:hypothetical protein
MLSLASHATPVGAVSVEAGSNESTDVVAQAGSSRVGLQRHAWDVI